MVIRSLHKIAVDISSLPNGVYKLCMVDKAIRILRHSEGVEILSYKKNTNEINKIKNDLFNLLNRVSIQDGNVYNEYYTAEGVIISSSKLLTIKYDNNNHQWCSLARSI